MSARAFASPARPIHAQFHLRVPVRPREVRLSTLAEIQPETQPMAAGPAEPQAAASAVTSPAAAAPPPAASTAGSTPVTATGTAAVVTSAVAVPPPAHAAPPAPSASREILLPGRKPSPEEERQRQQEREVLAQILATLRSTAAELRRQQQERLREWQRAAIELALTIASRLLYDRIQSGEFPIEARVREMIAQLEHEPVVAVRLHPQDLKLLRDRLGEQSLVGTGEQVRLLADPTLARGECRVEGRETLVLSDVVRQLEQIREELLRSLGHVGS